MTAVNGVGWEVQEYFIGYGWYSLRPVFPTKEQADAWLLEVKRFGGDKEFRVYEALSSEV